MNTSCFFLCLFSCLFFVVGQTWKQAGTTRYWDCNQPFCEPGVLPYPHSYAMKSAPKNDPNGAIIYGTAAASDSILQGKTACEKCYLLKKTGTTGPKIVVKVNNWCPCQYNPSCCSDHFDIAVPGFDWAQGSVSNVCVEDDKSINYINGAQACQNWYLGSTSCNCKEVSSDPILQTGCSLFLSLGWDNPTVDYTPVACPSGISGVTSDSATDEQDSSFPVIPVVVGVTVGVVALVVLVVAIVFVRRRIATTEVV